ncbi:hypothetical protein PUN28_014079 [Cardiocondyla obscurior]|uniref:Uncharacterized protein n=1 Tax=Cardiocondyla obscurior TaxID=286306 RepID=A0AAW2F6K7_9HYME
MTNQILSVSGQFANLLWRVVCWLFETIEQILTVILDCLARLIELILVIIKLIFQVICFVRDLCIDSMQTFANVFRGIVNVVNSIGYDDVEDFASACIVVALCAGGIKMFINLLKRNSHAKLFNIFGQEHSANNNLAEKSHNENICFLHERKTGRRPKRRTNRRYRSASRKNN